MATSDADLAAARQAIAARDLPLLGEVAERSCLAMHASALAARPAVLYWNGATVEGYRAVQTMRKAGVHAWFTCDAGPHVKALTRAADAAEVARRLGAVPGVRSTRICLVGGPAEVLE